MKIWQVQRNRVDSGNLGGGFASDSSAAPAFISQQVEKSTVENCKLVPFWISSAPGVSDNISLIQALCYWFGYFPSKAKG